MGRFPIQTIGLGKQIDFLGRNMDNVETTAVGEAHFSIFRGSGLEFKGYREYTLQDDSKDIDWKASLRADKLLIKEYYQEKGMDVVFLFDVSETMLFGSQKKIKAHYAAEFVLALAGAAIESNYNVGLICFSDKVNKAFMPSSAASQLGIFFDILGEHATYGGEYDLSKALEFADASFGPGTVVVLISDFLGNKISLDSFKDRFKQTARKFDIISAIIRDPRDEFMPSEDVNVVVSNPYGKGDVLFNVSKVKKIYEDYSKEQKSKLKKFLKNVGSDYLELYTDKSFVDPTLSFFMRRDAMWK